MSTTDKIDAVEVLVDILKASDSAFWDFEKPDVFRLHDVPPKDRQNKRDDAIYVHNPVDVSLERFGVDPNGVDNQAETTQPTILTYSLDDFRVRKHTHNIVTLLKEDYQSDNYGKTLYHSIEPAGIRDGRAETSARQTDHYIYAVDVDMRRVD